MPPHQPRRFRLPRSLFRFGRDRKILIVIAAGEHATLPTGDVLEALQGGRRGQNRIRINDQRRIRLGWPAGSVGPGTWKLSITTNDDRRRKPWRDRRSVPGEHLRGELNTLGMSAAELSRQFGVQDRSHDWHLERPAGHYGGHGFALRLAHFFGASAEFWLNLQSCTNRVWGGRNPASQLIVCQSSERHFHTPV